MVIGTYSDREIKGAIERGQIQTATQFEDSQIQPSSIDLTLGNKIYCMPCSSLPGTNLQGFLESRKKYLASSEPKTFLHANQVYVVELNESLKLPPDISARSNPKSTSGRIDVHVRLLTEGGKHFDEVSPGYQGKLYLEIYSQTFDLIVQPGQSLNQLRVFDSSARALDEGRLEYLCRSGNLVYDKNGSQLETRDYLEKDSLFLTLDLDKEISGYVAKKDTPPLDLSLRNIPRFQFWEPVTPQNGEIIISKGSFYIFNSTEVTEIPNDHCAEMADVSTNTGEFRAHYAGFFDPGFKARSVLEVRNSGAPFRLVHGQRIANLRFFKLKSTPEKIYGINQNSNYQGQELKLAKFFDD